MASDKAVIRVFMYGFLAAAAAMLVFQNASSKWIRIIEQNPRSNLTLYFGVWRYCAQGYDCNGDQGECSAVHRCRFITDDDMKADPESLTFYRAARSFSFITIILVLAVANITVFWDGRYGESNFIRNAIVCIWTAASVTAGLSNFAFLYFAYNRNIDDLVVILSARVNFDLAFAICWFSMLLMFGLIFLAHNYFTKKIRPYKHVLYQPVSKIQDTSSAISLYIASSNGGSPIKAAVIQNSHASAAKDVGRRKQHAY